MSLKSKIGFGAILLLWMLFYVVMAFTLFMGCSILGKGKPPYAHQPLTLDYLVSKELKLRVNDVEGTGTIVVPILFRNRIDFERSYDRVNIATCHRSTSHENVSGVVLELTDLEMQGGCPVQITAIDMKSQYIWGAYIDFKTPETVLPLILACNGTQARVEGVAVCQAKAGLFQSLHFHNRVIVSPDPKCELGAYAGTDFQFQMPEGVCIYRFEELSGEKRVARVTLIGYKRGRDVWR